MKIWLSSESNHRPIKKHGEIAVTGKKGGALVVEKISGGNVYETRVIEFADDAVRLFDNNILLRHRNKLSIKKGE